MPKIIVNTGGTQDGEYDLDLEHFTWRERAYITELSGTLPPEYFKKWFENDPMTILATVAVMMQRAGKVPNIDAIMDADSETAIKIDYSDILPAEGEEDEGPPAEASPSETSGDAEKSDDSGTGG